MSSQSSTDTIAEQESDQPLVELSGFQRDVLAVLAAEGPEYGLGVKRRLEQYYGEVNHGRLYPNLDELSEQGYVAIGSRDRRTNEYSLTEEGRQALAGDVEWRRQVLETETETDTPTESTG